MFLRISSGILGDVEARHRAPAGSGRQQPAKHADDGGFTRAVGAQETEDLAFAHLEGNMVHGHEVAKGLDQIADFEGAEAVLAWRGVTIESFSALRTSAMKTSSSDGTMRWKTAGPWPSCSSLRAQCVGGGARGTQEQVQSGAGRLRAEHAFGFEQHLARGPRIARFHLVAMLGNLAAHGVRRVALDQPSLVHQAHPVAALRLIQISGGDQDRDSVLDQLVQDGPEIAARDRIDAVGRLVQEQDFRPVQQGTHEAQLLLHAAGKLAGLAIAERLHAGHAQQFRQQAAALGDGDAEQVGVELHVFVDGQIDIEAEALGHVADGVLDGLGIAGPRHGRPPRPGPRWDPADRTACAAWWSCRRHPGRPVRRSRRGGSPGSGGRRPSARRSAG